MLLHRLCLAVGSPHPDYLGNLLTRRQLNDWKAFAKLEPFGPAVDRAYFGTLAASIYNVNRGKDAAVLSWRDIFPPHDSSPDANDDRKFQEFAELDFDERQRRWTAMSDAERAEFEEYEARNVMTYMNMQGFGDHFVPGPKRGDNQADQSEPSH